MALVGGSGSGKSTLLQLLQRLYEPDSGTVSVDGQRLQRLDLHHYRRSIGEAYSNFAVIFVSDANSGSLERFSRATFLCCLGWRP